MLVGLNTGFSMWRKLLAAQTVARLLSTPTSTLWILTYLIFRHTRSTKAGNDLERSTSAESKDLMSQFQPNAHGCLGRTLYPALSFRAQWCFFQTPKTIPWTLHPSPSIYPSLIPHNNFQGWQMKDVQISTYKHASHLLRGRVLRLKTQEEILGVYRFC